MPKITDSKSRKGGKREVVHAKTVSKPNKTDVVQKWWPLKTEQERAQAMINTVGYLKEQSQYRVRQASMYSKLYDNKPLFGILGGTMAGGSSNSTNQLPLDRPTMNVIQSCVDTLTSRISQSRPRPVFLTDNADYKSRNLAKQLNQFISGEFHQTETYKKMSVMLADACKLGTGIVKICESNKKVALERVLMTELLVDPNDSLWGCPRQMYQLALVDRDVLASMFPGKEDVIEAAEQAYPDMSGKTSRTVSDQVMLVEGWHLPSSPEASDGAHMLALTSGSLLDETYSKETFPFVFLNYSNTTLGFFGQSLCEQLMGTQMEINKLLATISSSINLVGVPRVFVEDGSKVVKAHLNNQIGAIVTYRGTKPQYEVAPCVPQEMYAQLQRLVEYAYQQSGVAQLSASGQKPLGLNSGVAMREYDNLQSDRFATLNRKYDDIAICLAYQMIDKAKDICERDGEYQTIYPNKDGTREINLPEAKLLDDPFIIQCYDASSLPRDPAGRLEKVTELMQAGIIDLREGRRLLDYPDLQQEEKLANSGEERILQALDQIVEEGKYNPPDPFMDPDLCILLSKQYYNLYVAAKLEENKAEMLRTFNAQAVALKQAMQPPAPAPMAGPQAVPQPLPQSPMLPRAVG